MNKKLLIIFKFQFLYNNLSKKSNVLLLGAVSGLVSAYVLYLLYAGDARYSSLVVFPALAAVSNYY